MSPKTFYPRKNMIRRAIWDRWECRDENGCLACDGGPSIILDGGSWQFWIQGIGLHRLEGPASSTGKWFINNKNVTEEIHQFAEENSIDLENLTDADKVMIALKFG